MNGEGKLCFSNGAIYTGAFKGCKRHGHGVMTDGGARYVGDWRDDRRNGQGTMTYSQ